MSVCRHGEGWQVRWREEGRHRARTFSTRSDAQSFDEQLRRRRRLGVHAPGEASQAEFGVWMVQWCEEHAAEWAESTRRVRAPVIERWITPFLGRARLCDLGAQRLREYRAQVLAAGCPPTQFNHARSVISAALGAAVEAELIPANPTGRLRRARVRPSRPRALSPLEVEEIRAHLVEQVDVVFWGLLTYAGLRPGEARALTWGSVGNVMVVDASLSERGVALPTKTMSRRTVEVLAPLGRDIDELRPPRPRSSELVCRSPEGRPINLNNWRKRVLAPALAKAGLEAVPYDGRHTFASLLIHEGRSLPYVTAALGHSSATTTLRHYAHVIEDAKMAPSVTMVQAILAARAQVEGDRVRDRYAGGEVLTLSRHTRRGG